MPFLAIYSNSSLYCRPEPELCLPEPGGSIDLSSAGSRPPFSHIFSRHDRSRSCTVSRLPPTNLFRLPFEKVRFKSLKILCSMWVVFLGLLRKRTAFIERGFIAAARTLIGRLLWWSANYTTALNFYNCTVEKADKFLWTRPHFVSTTVVLFVSASIISHCGFYMLLLWIYKTIFKMKRKQQQTFLFKKKARFLSCHIKRGILNDRKEKGKSRKYENHRALRCSFSYLRSWLALPLVGKRAGKGAKE